MALRYVRFAVGFLALWLPLASAPLRAAQSNTPSGVDTNTNGDADSDDEPATCAESASASLEIDVSKRGFAYRNLAVCFDPAREDALRAALPAATGCLGPQNRIEGDGTTGLVLNCYSRMSRTGLWFTGREELAPLIQTLRANGVTILHVEVDLPNYAKSGCEGVTASGETLTEAGVICEYNIPIAKDADDSTPSAVLFHFGFEKRLVLQLGAFFLTLLVVPVFVALRFRVQAARATGDAIPSLVFSHRRFLWGLGLGGALIWWTAIDYFRLADAVQLLALNIWPQAGAWFSLVAEILCWIPAAVVYMACLVLSSPILLLRGIQRTSGEAIRQSFWSVARFALPVGIFILGVQAAFVDVRALAVVGVAFVLLLPWVQRKSAAASGVSLQAVTSGELRDRVFEIARQGKAKLAQLYLMPTEKMRMANAFAHAGQNIFLTDYLLKQLNKREVDAIVAHEVTHLTGKHLRWIRLAVIGACCAAGGLAVYGSRFAGGNLPIGPAAYAVLLLAVFFISRRNEFAADAGSVKITGDAAALITGLAKVSSLNSMPIHWGKLDEKMLTHPSTLGRMKRLAKLGGIPEEQIPQLLDEAKKPSTDLYQIPASALASQRVYSSVYKGITARRHAWASVLLMALIPALVAFAAHRVQLAGWMLAAAYVAGIAATMGAAFALQDMLQARAIRKLEARLREKFTRQDGFAPSSTGVLASVSPGAAPRLFENSWAWDLGILSIDGDRLIYRGEEAQFALRRERVVNAALRPGLITWRKNPSIYIDSQTADGHRETFAMRLWSAGSMTENTRLTREFFARLEQWRNGSLVTADSPANREVGAVLDSDGVSFGNVTSSSPKKVASAKLFIRILMLDCWVGAAMAVIFGFRVGMMESEPTTANSTGWAIFYVIVAMWITHIALFLPFWMYRDPERAQRGKVSQTAAPTA